MTFELNAGKLLAMFAPLWAMLAVAPLVSQIEDDRRLHGV